MAVTPSTYVELGSAAPAFSLPDTVSGQQRSLDDVRGEKGTVVMFICNHCPFVLHVNAELVRLANDYAGRGIGFVAISSNDAVAYPQDGPERMKVQAERLGYPFPYLYDASQAVAKAYDAACTPDFYVFDGDLKLVYHGQLDDSRPGNRQPVTGQDMREALNACLAGTAYTEPQKPSVGCNIKWK
ncbi:MAG: thioredoxin family protein [Rhodothermales bacterium]